MIDVNDPPTAVSLVSNGIYENATAGAVVGSLRAQDQDANQTHSFAVISGQGEVILVSSRSKLMREILFGVIN